MSVATTVESPRVVQLLGFARRHSLNNPKYRHPLDRRTEAREELIVPAVIQPVSNCLKSLDDPIDVVTRDISSTGIGLITESGLDHDLYTVRLTIRSEEMFFLALKVWSAARGPFDFVGMDAIRKLPT